MPSAAGEEVDDLLPMLRVAMRFGGEETKRVSRLSKEVKVRKPQAYSTAFVSFGHGLE